LRSLYIPRLLDQSFGEEISDANVSEMTRRASRGT